MHVTQVLAISRDKWDYHVSPFIYISYYIYRQVLFNAISFLHDFTLTWLVTPLFKFTQNFQFNIILHTWSVAAYVLCWRLVDIDITITSSGICMGWLRWWYNHVASIAFAFVIKMSVIHKSTSPCVIQVKNWWKTINTEEKLDIISQLEKGEQTVYTYAVKKKRRLCYLAVILDSLRIVYI